MSAYRIMEDVAIIVITQQDHTIVTVGVDIGLVLTEKAVLVSAATTYVYSISIQMYVTY